MEVEHTRINIVSCSVDQAFKVSHMIVKARNSMRKDIRLPILMPKQQ